MRKIKGIRGFVPLISMHSRPLVQYNVTYITMKKWFRSMSYTFIKKRICYAYVKQSYVETPKTRGIGKGED